MKISEEQIQEWTENPITEALIAAVQEEINEIQDTPITNCLFFGEPNKTHENLVNLESRGAVWREVLDVLKGDWSYFLEEEDEVRD